MKYTWDNANIVESYPGICSPLTFSFARKVYKEVYAQLAISLGVSRKNIDLLSRDMETFLGYFNGRFYYNLGSWCKLVSYIPGIGNSQQMLQIMMGVTKDDQIKVEKRNFSLVQKLKIIIKLIIVNYKINGLTNAWLEKFDREFKLHQNKISNITNAYDAMEAFFKVENRFLNDWYVPIYNDIFTMIYSGTLRKIYQHWVGCELDLEFLTGIGNKGSIESITLLNEIVSLTKSDKRIITQIHSSNDKKLWELLNGNSKIKSKINYYINNFGMRNTNDLKLESQNIKENPEKLAGLVRQYLKSGDRLSLHKTISKENKKINLPLPKKIFIKYLIKTTKNTLSRREQMRIKRSQIFGMVREIILMIAKDLKSKKVINQTDDIFYLELEEVFSILRGTSTNTNILKELINLRVRAEQSFKKNEVNPHFTTEGIPKADVIDSIKLLNQNNYRLVGKANYPGYIIGDAIILNNPEISGYEIRNKIIVCKQTDPSWVPILAVCSGIVVERGSILSHAAIIARELKLPSIIGVENVTRIIKTGDKIVLDSKNGTIEKYI